jgi:hypothetical protein
MGFDIGGLTGGFLGFVGQQQTNQKNWDIADAANRASASQAQNQMDFQERMRSTQYQTAVEDMKKAGLNPMLAYSQGGAGTPTGAMGSVSTAQMKNSLGAGVAAYNSASTANADVNLKDASTTESISRTNVNDQTAKKLDAETASIVLGMPNISQELKNKIAIEILTQEQKHLTSAQTGKTRAEELSTRQGYTIKKPEEEMSKTQYGQLRPYARDIGQGIGSATQAVNALKPKQLPYYPR